MPFLLIECPDPADLEVRTTGRKVQHTHTGEARTLSELAGYAVGRMTGDELRGLEAEIAVRRRELSTSCPCKVHKR